MSAAKESNKEEIIIPKAIIDSPKKTIQDKVSKNIQSKLLDDLTPQDIQFQTELQSLIIATKEYIETLARLKRELYFYQDQKNFI